MTNISGSKANPIDWEMYESMAYPKEWTGGWVILNPNRSLEQTIIFSNDRH